MKTIIVSLFASCVVSLAQTNNYNSPPDKMTPLAATERLLGVAQSGGSPDTVKLLLEKGADINAKDSEGWTPLHHAARSGNVEIIKALLERGADVNAKNNNDVTALMSAASRGYVEIAKLLFEKGADVSAKDTYGDTPLMFAAEEGKTNSIEFLLEKRADVNAKRNDGRTALMFAAEKGQTEVVNILLDKGADINAIDTNGWGAESLADLFNQTNTAEFFNERLRGVNAALIYAANVGDTEAVKRLLDKGADVNTKKKDDSGDTLLILLIGVACSDNTNMVELLLDRGADLNATNNFGETALISAAKFGNLELIKFLLDKGANLNAKDNVFGETVLMTAVQSGVTNVVKFLLARGADINAVDLLGTTALGLARERENAAEPPLHVDFLKRNNGLAREMVQLLKKAGATALSASDSSFNVLVASGTNTDSSGYVTNSSLLTPFTVTNSAGVVFTNAVLVKLMPNKFIYKTPGGAMGMLRLDSLSKDLQDKFGYDPQTAQAADETENLKKARQQELAQLQRELAAQPANLPVQSQSVVSDISRSIRANAGKKWPTDYDMQKYEVDKQTEAYNWVVAASSASGVPQEVFSQIKTKAAGKWPDDYDMQKYEIEKQVKAYGALH